MRSRVARILEYHAETIVAQAVAVFPYAGAQRLDTDDRARLAEASLELLLAAVRDGGCDARDGGVGDVRRLAQDRSVGMQQLFGLLYLLERTALQELAEALRAESVQWSAVSELVRRASVDVLGALAEYLLQEHGGCGLRDPLTTLHARPVVEIALEKEIYRAQRFKHGLALILFDVDHLAEINGRHGYGFGDRVLERIGIVMRNYFREHDWVARWSEDTFVVLLPETRPAHAELLADRVRVTIEERLRLRDYRTDERVSVTVSMAVVVAEPVDKQVTAGRLIRVAEQAMYRAKHAGRNRVEKADVSASTVAEYESRIEGSGIA
jgi:diguanylate cyclase (GGDEF)-like protein